MTFSNSREVDWCPSPYGKRCDIKRIASGYKQGNRYIYISWRRKRTADVRRLIYVVRFQTRHGHHYHFVDCLCDDKRCYIILSRYERRPSAGNPVKNVFDAIALSLHRPAVVYRLEIARRSINVMRPTTRVIRGRRFENVFDAF